MRKQALVIGINFAGSDYPLFGSVNSATAWARLYKILGFEVNLLAEADATRKNIANAISSLFQASDNKGDPIEIIWCGHGMQLDLQSPDGSTQRIYALVPYDAVLPAVNWNLTIPTYQWAAKLAQRPGHARLFTCLDVCFSASFEALDKQPATRRMQAIRMVPTITQVMPIFADVVSATMTASLSAAGLNNYLSFHPGNATQETVQEVIGGVWQCVWSKCVQDVFKAHSQWSYANVFAEARRRALLLYSLASPEMDGDVALAKKRVFT